MKGNGSIISDAQSKTFSTKIKDNTRSADLLWSGLSYNNVKNKVSSSDQIPSNRDIISGASRFVSVYGGGEDVNRVLFWLSSESGDYGRGDPDKGANLKKYIGKIISEGNIQTFANELKDAFNYQFQSKNVQLMNLTMVADRGSKRLYIYFIVYNKATKEVSKEGVIVEA